MGKMTIGQMVAQLAGGMLISTQIFVITLLFSLPLGDRKSTRLNTRHVALSRMPSSA